MKRVLLHSKKVISNHWFIILIAGAISFIIGIGMFLLLLIWSMTFTQDPIDVNDLMDNFTEGEMEIVLAETIDESVSDEEYLSTLAKYQSYFCPKKVDYLTLWTGSIYTGKSYILYYEVKKRFEEIDRNILKENILTHINKNSVLSMRLVRSNKNMIVRYTDRKTSDYFEIVITSQELMAA